MATRIEAKSNKSGGTDVLIRPLTPEEEERRLNRMMGGQSDGGTPGEASPARRMFQQTAAVEERPQFQKIEVGGETLYARAFDYVALQEFNQLNHRNRDGALRVSAQGDAVNGDASQQEAASLIYALLHVGIVTEPARHAPRRFTDRDEVWEGVESTDPAHHVMLSELVGSVVLLNKHLFPQVREQVEKLQAAQQQATDTQKKSRKKSPSTRRRTTSPVNGSSPTASTATPSPSPTGSTAATE
jgi:hypothetical protein